MAQYSSQAEVVDDVQHAGAVDSDTDEKTIDDPPFPEGGWQAWRTIAGAFLVQFATFGYTNAFGVYQGYFYVREYLDRYTPSQIGWIGGTQIFLVLASGIITGRAFDNGYFYHMMISGALLNSFSFFMLSLSHPNQYYQVFLSHGLGGGLAAGLTYTPALAIGTHYFKRHRGLSIGIAASGAALGAVVHPIILNHLFHGPGSFANTVRITAALNSGLLLVANLIMRTRLPPNKGRRSIPFAEFARDTPYVFVVLGGMMQIFGISFVVFFIQLFSTIATIGEGLSIYILPILNASSIAGRIIPVLFVHRCGVVNLNIIFAIALATMIYSLAAVKTVIGIVAFAIFFGFFEGGVITLVPTMLASLAKDIDEVGARVGVSFASSGTIGLFVAPIDGALLTTQLHWWRPIVFSGTAVLASASCYIIAQNILARRRNTYIV